MTLDEFKDLDELEQLEVFWKAIVVGEYSKDGFTLNLGRWIVSKLNVNHVVILI